MVSTKTWWKVEHSTQGQCKEDWFFGRLISLFDNNWEKEWTVDKESESKRKKRIWELGWNRRNTFALDDQVWLFLGLLFPSCIWSSFSDFSFIPFFWHGHQIYIRCVFSHGSFEASFFLLPTFDLAYAHHWRLEEAKLTRQLWFFLFLFFQPTPPSLNSGFWALALSALSLGHSIGETFWC